PSGSIVINYTVDGVAGAITSEVTDILRIGGQFPYCVYMCSNGNGFQEETAGSVNPFVANIKEYNDLDINKLKKMYLSGDKHQQRLAVWMAWKIDHGKQASSIVEELVNGDETETMVAILTICRFRIYHPLIIVEVQKRLEEKTYSPGSENGSLDEETIVAIRRFQQSQGIEPTGFLGEETFRRLFTQSD
ncbi:peptidoglycan-binding domain-containing protein, partial [Planctomycetota bacterium]